MRVPLKRNITDYINSFKLESLFKISIHDTTLSFSTADLNFTDSVQLIVAFPTLLAHKISAS